MKRKIVILSGLIFSCATACATATAQNAPAGKRFVSSSGSLSMPSFIPGSHADRQYGVRGDIVEFRVNAMGASFPVSVPVRLEAEMRIVGLGSDILMLQERRQIEESARREFSNELLPLGPNSLIPRYLSSFLTQIKSGMEMRTYADVERMGSQLGLLWDNQEVAGGNGDKRPRIEETIGVLALKPGSPKLTAARLTLDLQVKKLMLAGATLIGIELASRGSSDVTLDYRANSLLSLRKVHAEIATRADELRRHARTADIAWNESLQSQNADKIARDAGWISGQVSFFQEFLGRLGEMRREIGRSIRR